LLISFNCFFSLLLLLLFFFVQFSFWTEKMEYKDIYKTRNTTREKWKLKILKLFLKKI